MYSRSRKAKEEKKEEGMKKIIFFTQNQNDDDSKYSHLSSLKMSQRNRVTK